MLIIDYYTIDMNRYAIYLLYINILNSHDICSMLDAWTIRQEHTPIYSVLIISVDIHFIEELHPILASSSTQQL